MTLPFAIEIRPGRPVYEQIVYAVKRALATGALSPGDRFPSVRGLSQELGINPNTVQKAFAELVAQGLLEVHSGQGCYLTLPSALARGEGARELGPLLETLAVEALRLGLSEVEVRKALSATWQRLKKE